MFPLILLGAVTCESQVEHTAADSSVVDASGEEWEGEDKTQSPRCGSVPALSLTENDILISLIFAFLHSKVRTYLIRLW